MDHPSSSLSCFLEKPNMVGWHDLSKYELIQNKQPSFKSITQQSMSIHFHALGKTQKLQFTVSLLRNS